MNFVGAMVNVCVQFFGLFGIYYLNINWAIYPTMALLCILIGAQTIAAGAMLSAYTNTSVITKDYENIQMKFLVSIIYGISVYQIYLLGFVFFSGVAAIHVAILILTIFFRFIKKG